MSIKVYVENGDLDRAIKKWSKRCLKEGLLRELRDRQTYEKPSMIEHKRVTRLKRAKYLGKTK